MFPFDTTFGKFLVKLFCFVNLRWLYNGWTSNILSGGYRCNNGRRFELPNFRETDTYKLGKTKSKYSIFNFAVLRTMPMVHALTCNELHDLQKQNNI